MYQYHTFSLVPSLPPQCLPYPYLNKTAEMEEKQTVMFTTVSQFQGLMGVYVTLGSILFSSDRMNSCIDESRTTYVFGVISWGSVSPVVSQSPDIDFDSTQVNLAVKHECAFVSSSL